MDTKYSDLRYLFLKYVSCSKLAYITSSSNNYILSETLTIWFDISSIVILSVVRICASQTSLAQKNPHQVGDTCINV